MFFRIVRSILWCFILPVLIGASRAFYEYIGGMNLAFYRQRLFVYGAVSFLALHSVLYSRQAGKSGITTRAWTYLYVFAHEIMHAIATLLCGGKFFKLRISSRGGSVRTTKSNIFIGLAPYLVPFYTLVVTVAYLIITFVFKNSGFGNEFIFLLGFTLTFHVVLTVDFLKTHQPDLRQIGSLWSISIIYLVNLALLVLILRALFNLSPVTVFFKEAWFTAWDIYLAVIDKILESWQSLV